MMKRFGLVLFISFSISHFNCWAKAGDKHLKLHTPVKEYQFMTTFDYKDAAEKSKSSTAYLWIPPSCKRVRGVVVLSQNVLEQWLAEHPLFRKSCAKMDLAIVWACPGFFVDGKDHFPQKNALTLQNCLNNLANISGYEELNKVPWLPIGHSGTNNMVRALLEAKPERIIAAITMKGGPGFKSENHIPVMCNAGEYFEWNQHKEDLINPLKRIPNYENVLKERKEKNQPLTYFFDPNTGHFDCSEQLTKAIANYVLEVSKARLTTVDSILNPINLNDGWVAGLPLPGAKFIHPKPYQKATKEERNLPWYFTKQQAIDAVKMAQVDFNRKPQIASFTNIDGSMAGFNKGIVWPIPYQTGLDGVTFELNPVFLMAIPDTFRFANTALGHGKKIPEIIPLCGNVKQTGKYQFQITPERNFKSSATYLVIRQEGDDKYRTSISPGQLVVNQNNKGLSQLITIDTLVTISQNVKHVKLKASSTSGMPVGFFVKAGPAVVKNDVLTISNIPPKTKFPVKVTVVAYQWGRNIEPFVKTAPFEERSFEITKDIYLNHKIN